MPIQKYFNDITEALSDSFKQCCLNDFCAFPRIQGMKRDLFETRHVIVYQSAEQGILFRS